MINEEWFQVGDPECIFGEDTRRSPLARRLLEKEGYELVTGSALLKRGHCKEVHVLGSNPAIRTMGIGRINCECPVRQRINVHESFIGVFCYLNLDVLALVEGDVSFHSDRDLENGTLNGKLAVRISAHMKQSLVILDEHKGQGGIDNDMGINVLHALDHKTVICICGSANKAKFQFDLNGRGLRDYLISESCRVEASESGDMRTYRIFEK